MAFETNIIIKNHWKFLVIDIDARMSIENAISEKFEESKLVSATKRGFRMKFILMYLHNL